MFLGLAPIAGGLLSNFLGNRGGLSGALGGLGDIAGNFLDPLGLFGGNGNQTENDMSSGQMMEEFQNMLDDFLNELMAIISEETGTNVDTGSGDDTVIVGDPA